MIQSGHGESSKAANREEVWKGVGKKEKRSSRYTDISMRTGEDWVAEPHELPVVQRWIRDDLVDFPEIPIKATKQIMAAHLYAV